MTPPVTLTAIDDRLGLEFREIMSGTVTRTGGPEEEFVFDALIKIPSLNRFRANPPYVAEIAEGTITWGGRSIPVIPGTYELFAPVNPTRTQKEFRFHYGLTDEAGVRIDAEGRKEVRDDAGIDSIADLTTLFLVLKQGGNEVARGTLRIHVAEFFRQVDTITIVGTPPPNKTEEREAREVFFSFMNTQLREVYKEVPEIFRDDDALSPEERKTLELLIRVMLPDPLPADGPQFQDVVDSLNMFLADASVRQIDDLRGALRVASIIVPLLKKDVKKLRQLVAETMARRERTDLRDTFDTLQSLLALPYYAHPKADAMLGYRRPILADEKVRPDPSNLRVDAVPPAREFDVVVIGSGPSGSLVAARAAATGKSVLVLEAGPYVREETIDGQEIRSIARYYKQSGFQLANEGRSHHGPPVRILQGQVMGGGGVVNNAVCLPLPPDRFQRWANASFPISRDDLDLAYDRVADDLKIDLLSKTMAADRIHRRNPASKFLARAWGEPIAADLRRPVAAGHLYECPVNLNDCQGLGLCNVGCPVARKNNALQVYLREAQADGAVLVDRAEVVGLETVVASGKLKVTEAVVRLRSGDLHRVKGKEFVLGAGPIGSTAILLRSENIRRMLEANKVPVGQRFSANLGSPVFAFCFGEQHALPSVQIAHYWLPSDPAHGFVIESWYNPPAANALTMPGFQDEHARRMRKYASSVAAAPLAGTRPRGRIRLDGKRVRIDLPIGGAEIRALRIGLVQLCKAFLHRDNTEVASVAVGFDNGLEFVTAHEVDQFDAELQKVEADPKQAFRLRFGTGHPQGGNAMSNDPVFGVVAPDFRVVGTENLRVCDGSLFPDVAGVNPQWTIMALAHLCSEAMPR